MAPPSSAELFANFVELMSNNTSFWCTHRKGDTEGQSSHLAVQGTAPLCLVSHEVRRRDPDDRVADDVDCASGSISSVIVPETAAAEGYVGSSSCDADASSSAVGVYTAIEEEFRVGDEHSHLDFVRPLGGLQQRARVDDGGFGWTRAHQKEQGGAPSVVSFVSDE